MKHINDKYMHLTNYSIQKKNNEYESNADDTVCQGHKWYVQMMRTCAFYYKFKVCAILSSLLF